MTTTLRVVLKGLILPSSSWAFVHHPAGGFETLKIFLSQQGQVHHPVGGFENEDMANAKKRQVHHPWVVLKRYDFMEAPAILFTT